MLYAARDFLRFVFVSNKRKEKIPWLLIQ